MFFSNKVPLNKAPILCPNCLGTLDKTMDRNHWRGLELDICSHCHGIWLDFKEIAQVDEVATLEEVDAQFEGTYQPNTPEKLQQELQEDQTRRCPRDRTLLTRHEWRHDSKIVMDYCPSCSGIYLDPGELEGYVALSEKDVQNPEKLCETVLAQLREESQALDAEMEAYQHRAREFINPAKALEHALNQLFK